MLQKFTATIQPYIPLILRLSLGFVFLWSGLSKIISPDNAIGICTNRAEAIDFVRTLGWLPFDPEVFVWVQSGLEFILGLALLAGVLVPLSALVSTLAFVLFFALMDFSLIWKNVGLLGAALALLGSTPDRWTLSNIHKRWRERAALDSQMK